MGDGPRGTPTVDGDRLYAVGGNGDLVCLEAATGKTIWKFNLRTDFRGGTPGWGYSESPLIVDDMLIVTRGGAVASRSKDMAAPHGLTSSSPAGECTFAIRNR